MENLKIGDIFYICTAFNEENGFRINILEITNINFDNIENDNVISYISSTKNKSTTAANANNNKDFQNIIKSNLGKTKMEAIEKYINGLESKFLSATVNYNTNYINY